MSLWNLALALLMCRMMSRELSGLNRLMDLIVAIKQDDLKMGAYIC